MEETFLVLMIKDSKTGFLDRELNSYKIEEYEDYIINMYAEEEKDSYNVHMVISLPDEVTDEEFDAIYDSYDEEIYNDSNIISFEEMEDCFNPTWKIVFSYIEDDEEMEKYITSILDIHKKELKDVFENISE